MKHLDHKGIHVSLWVAGAWLAWWFACRPASPDELQRLAERMTKEYGEMAAQQYVQRMSDDVSPSLLGAWHAFVALGHCGPADAGTAIATAAPILAEP